VLGWGTPKAFGVCLQPKEAVETARASQHIATPG